MTTKQIPNSPGQTGVPASDLVALPPGPGKEQTRKRLPGAKDFASVIDQAASNNTSKQAHIRTPKSAGRGRREDPAATSVRERASTSIRDVRDTPSKTRSVQADKPSNDSAATVNCSAPDSTNDTQADAPSEQVHGGSDSPRALVKSGKNTDTAATDEREASAEDATVSNAEAEEIGSPAQTTTPANIIPFPGTANAVIIPFPLTEAQAVPAVTRAALSAASNAAASNAIAPAAADASTAAATLGATKPPATASQEAVPSQAGIDVSALGLKPTSGDEQASPELGAGKTALPEPASSTAVTSELAGTNVVSVAFNAAQAGKVQANVSASGVAAQTQLPGDHDEAEETARQPLDTPVSASSAKIVLLRTDAGKPAPDAAANDIAPPPSPATEPAGISGARQEVRMESMTASKHAAAASPAGAESAFEAPAEFTTGNRAGIREVSDLSDRTKVATDWQSGRSVSASDRPVLDPTAPAPANAAASVERISSLVLREAALVKKYSSDSMAVVLRPDAETELFVHLTQRNGQVEATVRCERGDAQHLSALWPQLQESLALQKVRLAPLEDPAGARGNTNFQPPPGSLMSGGGERGTREDARPSQQQSMDEWPATPAPAAAAPHVRGGRGTRGRRISTSRPGWETWA